MDLVSIKRKLDAATALYNGATTMGEKHAAFKAKERLGRKLDQCEESPALLETVDGIELSSLGLGLGPTTNGKDCENCNGMGYEVNHGYNYKVCRGCNGGRVWYKDWRSGRDAVRDCFICRGSATVRIPGDEYYNRCLTCDGCGEIIIFNPVLLKGSLMSKSELT
jgi:hypothetical protein